jgi:hypothetical protein
VAVPVDWNYDDSVDAVERREPIEHEGTGRQDHPAGMERPDESGAELEPGAPAADRPDRAEDRWEWKGLELEVEANRIADTGIVARREAEGRDAEGNYTQRGITPAMRRIEAKLEHGTLAPDTEKFALKGPDRFKEKLAKLIGQRPDESVADLARQIHDGIRYTFLFDAGDYTDGVREACGKLENHGYELMRLVNRWDGEEYKGINSRWRDPYSGQFFEVQFHTPDSWEGKQATHDTYEKIDNPATPVGEIERLRAYQREVAAVVRIPDRCSEISDYRKPGS